MLQISQLLQSIKSNTVLPTETIEMVDRPFRCKLGLIGDIHGDLKSYLDLSSQAKYSIQLGDMYNSSGVHDFFSDRNPRYHKYITGNHDWLRDDFVQPKNNLGDYGVIQACPDIPFTIGFIRGANSIDKARRSVSDGRMHDPWHPEEEIPYLELCEAIDTMIEKKPSVMITHMAPLCVHSHLRLLSHYGLVKSRTMYALESLFEGYQPKLWVFGHYHQNMVCTINGTVFVCVNMNEMMPIV